MKNNVTVIAIALICILFCGHAYSQQNVHIDGTVTGAQYSNPINGAKAVLIKNATNARVDSTYTNSQGQYSMDYVWSGTNGPDNLENKLYPNPYTNQTNIEIGVEKNDNHTMLITGTDGKTLLQADLPLSAGQNKITLTGGQTGMHLITLTNGENTKTYKAMQTESTGSPINYTSTSTGTTGPTLKSGAWDGIMVGDEARLEFTKNGYFLKDTVFVIQPNQTINQIMEQIPHNFTTTLKPFLKDGTQITTINPNFTIKIEWSDGTTNTYPVANGQINIQKEIYTNPNGSLGTAWISNDTTKTNGFGVLNWSIGRQPHQVTNRPNIYQNVSSNHMANVEYQTEIPLDSLDQKVIYHYTIRNKAETQSGQYQNLDSEFSRGLVESSGGSKSGMFIDLAPYSVADSLDLVRFGFNLDTGTPNTPANQTRVDNIFQLTINLRYLPNGDTLLPPHRIYTIANFSDPKWQEVVTRNYENVVMTYLHNSTPGVGREWSSTHTYNGNLRLKNTTANYNEFNNDATIFEENFSAITGEEEGVGGLSPYIWNATTSQPSQYGKSISTIPALLNLGTGQ